MAPIVSGLVFQCVLSGENASLNPVLVPIEERLVHPVKSYWLSADGKLQAVVFTGEFGSSIQVQEELSDGTYDFPETVRTMVAGGRVEVRRGEAEVAVVHRPIRELE